MAPLRPTTNLVGERRSTAEQVAMRNREQSPLLRLPSDIRNRIHGLVLGNRRISVNDWVRFPRHYFAILKVCRQLREETAILHLSLNVIQFATISGLRLWLYSRPAAQRYAVQTIRFPFRELAVLLGSGGVNTVSRLPGLQRIEVFDVPPMCSHGDIRSALRERAKNESLAVTIEGAAS